MVEISRGKFDRLPRTPAGFTAPVFDDPGLRSFRPARPAGTASYPVLVHQAAALLHASFRPRLAATPLRFANPSPPSGWVEDFHLQAVDHARHTRRSPGRSRDFSIGIGAECRSKWITLARCRNTPYSSSPHR